MRLGDGPSDNFEDRTGSPGGFGFGGGGGGNMLGCLLPLVASRFGIVGVLVLLLGYCALTQLGGGGGGLLPGGQQTSAPSGQSTLSPENRRLLTGVLESTDSVWAQLFASSGARYVEPRLVAYTRGTQTACGMGQAAMGPFYCPNDQRIYIDPTFFDELSQRFGAPGDFAQAYVIAHEVGHHVQNLEGTLERAHSAQARSSEAEGNAIQVQVELQADCYAGVWAANAKDPQGRPALEPGDVEEGMRAAEAIGDDMLQKQSQGVVVPESFTHGSSAQRMAALRTGLQSGNPAACRFNR
ncbi:MAG TPA: neutral zinc metallopeptidase [Sphingomicrobium sp.]|nr:neutral zinc metallopeptidase [Sphingomicrobium sp.]